MPFRRNGRRRNSGLGQVINSVKNQTVLKQSTLASTNVDTNIANAVEVGVPTKVLGNEVPVGAQIFRIRVALSMNSASGGEDGNIDWYLAKGRGGQAFTDFPDPDWSAIGLAANRNQIFHTITTQFGSQDAGPYKFDRWLKVPKGMRRMRNGDFFFVKTQATIVASYVLGIQYKYYQ